MRLLCTELAHRVAVDREAWSRRAAKLTLQIISLNAGSRCVDSRDNLIFLHPAKRTERDELAQVGACELFRFLYRRNSWHMYATRCTLSTEDTKSCCERRMTLLPLLSLAENSRVQQQEKARKTQLQRVPELSTFPVSASCMRLVSCGRLPSKSIHLTLNAAPYRAHVCCCTKTLLELLLINLLIVVVLNDYLCCSQLDREDTSPRALSCRYVPGASILIFAAGASDGH